MLWPSHAAPHTQTCQGKAVPSAARALRSMCPGKAAGQGEKGVWGTAGVPHSCCFLSSTKKKKKEKKSIVGTGARNVTSLEFLTHLSQDSLQAIQTQNTSRMKNAVKSCLCTHLSNGKDKLNTIHLISGRSYSLYLEPPELLFRARGFLPTFLTVVISATRIAEDVLLHSSQDWEAQQVLCGFLVDCLFWTIFQFIISMHNIGNFPVNWHFLVQRSRTFLPLQTRLKYSLMKFAFIMVIITFLCGEKSPPQSPVTSKRKFCLRKRNTFLEKFKLCALRFEYLWEKQACTRQLS